VFNTTSVFLSTVAVGATD